MTGQEFWNAFLASFSLITASELGDKTFFITSIMAVKNPRLVVFVTSMAAMTVMNVLSICLGVLTTNVSPVIIHNLSCALFLIFGLKMIYEAFQMDADESENEVKEVEKLLADKEKNAKVKKEGILGQYSVVFMQVFSLIFLAEWGDRSQLSTILLAAKEGFAAVGAGAFAGYFLCNAIAVLGSRAISKIISVRLVSMLGGVVFVACAFLKYFA